MGFKERIQQYLRNKWDHATKASLLGKGNYVKKRAEQTGYQTKVWRDYYFIAACYAFALGNEEEGKKIISVLQQHTPQYDPSERFGTIRNYGEGLEKRLEELSLNDRERVNIMFTEFNESCNTSRAMQQFLERYQTFSFDWVAAYFPAMKKPLRTETVQFYGQPVEDAFFG